MDFLVEPFALGFQQRALMAGALAGLMSAVVGTWLVLRGMSFFGDAFVHGVVPGIAAAVVFDVNPLIGAALAAGVMVVMIEAVHRQTLLSEDTAIGLLFVGMLALGVVIISRLDNFSGSLTSILFGDALGVTAADLIGQAILAVVIIGAATLLYRPLLALSFNGDKAQLLGMRPKAAHAALLVLIAAAVIGSYQSVGTLLVFGLLVGPPATASLLSRTVGTMMLMSAGIALFSVWLGLTLSYYLDTAGSATMAIIPVVLFFLVLSGVKIKRGAHSRATRRKVAGDHSGAGVSAVSNAGK
ncbi:MAG: metal ABC transporter permease [Candidatus Nanopelagicales bacterium]|nr:metal ABC transporter permease [Candidatus Nanopelagicales bacterium]